MDDNFESNFRSFLDSQVKDHLLYYFDNMPNVDDKMISLLKGHLLIEEKLIALVKLNSEKPKALDEARFSFKQTLSLAKALYWYQNSDWLWDGINKLNKIRNKLAHNLNPKDLDNEISLFIKSVGSKYPNWTKKIMTTPGDNRLLHSIGLLYSELSAYLEACKNSKTQQG